MKHLKYVVQRKVGNRYCNTEWTRGGTPVSLKTAEVAKRLAEKRFPDETYRVHEFKITKKSK